MSQMRKRRGSHPYDRHFGHRAYGLHGQQEIQNPLLQDFPLRQKMTGGHNCRPLARIPQEQWEEVAQRYASGESLRRLAKRYGVSHETVRQTLRESLTNHGR